MTTVPLSWILILAAALFCIGLYAILARRTAIAVLMGLAATRSADERRRVGLSECGLSPDVPPATE